MRRLLLTTLASSLLLAGCGFHLRGLNNQLPEQFKKTYLANTEDGDVSLNQQVASLITLNGGQLVGSADAKVKVLISPIQVNSRQIAVSGDATLKEYEKTYQVTVSVVNPKDGAQIAQRVVSTIQQDQYDDKNVLASDQQTKITQNTAIRDLANGIIRYLTLIK